MAQSDLISIVIPMFNRAHLVSETLESVLKQSYPHWECIVVDDGSEDNSVALVKAFAQKDARFRCLERPANRPKGANACRNLGLEEAKGEFIVFFDSDDLMVPHHLEKKYQALQDQKADFSIAKTAFFNSKDDYLEGYYTFNKVPLNAYHYAAKKINFLTYDTCIKASLAKKIRFNEALQSGQEYNFHCKLLHLSENFVFVDEVLSLRRKHDDSIRANLKSELQHALGAFNAAWYTYLDLKHKAERRTRQAFLRICLIPIYQQKALLAKEKGSFVRALIREFGWQGALIFPLVFSFMLQRWIEKRLPKLY